ncbi:hypothetical protein CVT26_000346 [Gymnopilus dilepis]|uniref:Uncharacterized protein n=1 Tax=Gymnopilus dilepis TaxID=231916 RepID=A0A409VHJ4_9AGAR|nr:hypothetical protein CVT26_000346 [Gymnopilus dilepis]
MVVKEIDKYEIGKVHGAWCMEREDNIEGEEFGGRRDVCDLEPDNMRAEASWTCHQRIIKIQVVGRSVNEVMALRHGDLDSA